MQRPAPDHRLARTAAFWAVNGLDTARRIHWQAHPVVQEHFARRRSGLSSMETLARALGPTRGPALGLGVGAASSELELLGLDAVSTYVLCDVTSELLRAAEEAASASGLRGRIRTNVVDINHIELPADSYDLITFISSLHHVERLEHVLEQCYRALRPGGVFYADEYVGPNRFAFPQDQVTLARQIFRTLDPELVSTLPDLPSPDPLAVAAADPTESIRSEEILGLCQRVFQSARVASDDVCLTLILWYGLNHDAVYDTERGHDLVRWLLDIDQALVQSGRLPTSHAQVFARKPVRHAGS